MEIERNQLAELIVEDCQPWRAIHNYLEDSISTLEGFPCLTDCSSQNIDDILNNGANKLNIKKEDLISDLDLAVKILKEKYIPKLDIRDLHLCFSSEEEGDESNIPKVSYVLYHKHNNSKTNDFLIKFKDASLSPIVCNIELTHFGTIEQVFCDGHQFKNIELGSDKLILFFINGTDCYLDDDYKEGMIENITPLF